jgi:hypothetical protein
MGAAIASDKIFIFRVLESCAQYVAAAYRLMSLIQQETRFTSSKALRDLVNFWYLFRPFKNNIYKLRKLSFCSVELSFLDTYGTNVQHMSRNCRVELS